MTDIRTRLRAVEQLDPPDDLWNRASERDPFLPIHEELTVASGWRKVVAIAAALAVFGVAAFFGLRTWSRSGSPSSTQSAPAGNGAIAYSAGPDGDIGLIEGLVDPEDPSRPFVVRHAGGQKGGVAFAWSPDGIRLAYTDYRSDGTRGLYVVEYAGGRPRDLSPSLELADGFAWSPDGTSLVFGGCCDDGYQIYVVDADGAGLRQVSDVDADGVSGAFMPAWSPSGQRLAWVLTDYDEATSAETSAIVTTDLEGGNVAEIVRAPDPLETPVFSPDGSTLMFLRKGDDAYPDVYVTPVGAPASEPTRLTDPSMRVTSQPRWHPDSRSIVFAGQEVPTDNYGLYRIAVVGAEVSILLQDAYIGFPTWSPDGRTIAFVRDDAGSGRFAVATMEVRGRRTVDLVGDLTEAGPIDWQRRLPSS